MNEILTKISTHEVFATLDLQELASLSSIVARKTYKEGEIVFDHGQTPTSLFFIEDGSFLVHLTNNEYKALNPGTLFGEIGVINGDFRSGTVSAAETSTVITIDGIRLFEKEHVPPSTSLKIVRALSKRITNYLRSKEQISTRELIEEGENEHVEFKSTLRWNMRANKKDKAMEKAVLKTMAAFMNSEGGLLIVGVDDDGTILGMESDKFANKDKMLLHLTNLVKERIGSLFLNFLDFSVETYDGKDILRIDCQPATMPAYFRDDNHENFFIRTGPSTTDLRLSKVYTYIKNRFDMEN